MINEKELKLLQIRLIPTDLENTQDKASIASICRTTAEQKMSGICISDNHIPFVWSCLERHNIPILTRINSTENRHKTIKKIVKYFDDGVSFCEVDINDVLKLVEENFPTKKIIVSLPYYAITSRKKAVEILNSFSAFYGINLIQDGISEEDKLTSVFRLFDSIKDAQSIPKWILFDLPDTKNSPVFAQNILRLTQKTISGLDIKISFHLLPKTIKFFQ